jgi:hypothetical protein
VRSASCTWRRGAWISWLSLKTKVNGLSAVWPQNHYDGFHRFALKTGGDGFHRFGLKTSKPVVIVFSGLASKPMATVLSGLALKSVATVSPDLTLKPVVSFLIEPQNQSGGGFPSLSLKNGRYGLMIWASKSPRRFFGLDIKTKQTTVCRLHHKINGRAMV